MESWFNCLWFIGRTGGLMLFQKLLESGRAPVTVATSTFLTNQTSDASRTLTLSSGFAIGDMMIAMIANRTSPAPALLSGYTNIGSYSDYGNNRSLRLQYKIATSTSESITWTGAYGYLIAFKNATRIGQSSVGFTLSGTTISLPNLSNLDTTGKGYIIAGSYLVSIYTSVSSPYTLLVSGSTNIAAYVDNNTNSSLTSKTITASGSIANSYAIELLP